MVPFVAPPRSFEKDTADARTVLSALVVALAAAGLAASRLDPAALARGLAAIVRSPDILINDYVSVAGFGPALVNAALCAGVALLLFRVNRVSVSGPAMAVVCTIAGFSLFGKSIGNIWPGLLGAFLFSRASRRPFGENIIVALFGTALAPLSSEVAFGLGIPAPWNIPVAVAAGALAGFLLSPIARHVLAFHRGYNLYNIGFAAGFVGTVVMSTLRALGVPLSGGFAWAEVGYAAALPWLAPAFAALAAAGMLIDRGWPAGYRRLLGSSGRLVSDFVRYYGLGVTLVNMGVMGFLACGMVLLIGGSWNGPVLGGIFTIVGFSAFGKHPRNALPPMLGAAAMAALSEYGLDAPASQLAVLFASTLAPVCGEYGALPGFVVGAMHLVLVQVVGGLHGGLNLYNNGFAGGLASGLIVPVLEWIREWRRHEV